MTDSTSKSTEYEKQKEQVEQVWAEAPSAKAIWQSSIYIEHTMRLLTGGTAPHFMDYVKKNYLRDKPAPRALSIGCGRGEMDRYGHSIGLFTKCSGVDISPGAIAAARETAAAEKLPLDYKVMDLNTTRLLESYKQPFDLIFANASLHHIDRLEQVIKDVFELLKSDGLFFFFEYVGPSRFQWKPKTLEICNRILLLLPERLREGLPKVERLYYSTFANYDPSEAIHSEEVMSITGMFFDAVEIINGGTTLTHPLLNLIIRHFNEEDELELTILRLIHYMEEILIHEGVLESDTKLGIFRKRTLPVS